MCPDHTWCHNHVLITTDGRRWEKRLAPDLTTRERMPYRASVHALGGCRMVIDDAEPPGGLADRRWFSTDCGRGWRLVRWRPSGTVQQLPRDGVLSVECRTPRCTDYLTVLEPDSGRRRWVAGVPRLLAPSAQPVRQADGRWWLSGRDPVDWQWTVAVSDDGRTWSTVRPPLPGGDAVTLIVGRRHTYAVLTGTADRRSFGILGIAHSADGGRTWRQTRGFDRRHGQPRIMIDGLVRPNDLLILGLPKHAGAYWGSRDHGGTFDPATVNRVIAAPRWTRGGYVAVSADAGPAQWYRSPDGRQWTELALTGR